MKDRKIASYLLLIFILLSLILKLSGFYQPIITNLNRDQTQYSVSMSGYTDYCYAIELITDETLNGSIQVSYIITNLHSFVDAFTILNSCDSFFNNVTDRKIFTVPGPIGKTRNSTLNFNYQTENDDIYYLAFSLTKHIEINATINYNILEMMRDESGFWSDLSNIAGLGIVLLLSVTIIKYFPTWFREIKKKKINWLGL